MKNAVMIQLANGLPEGNQSFATYGAQLEPSWVCALKSLQLPPEKRGEELDGTGSVASTAPHPEENYGDTVDGCEILHQLGWLKPYQ